MSRSTAVVALVFVANGMGMVLPGCTGPHPFIREGDANSVEITDAGDVASTWPLARRHCAQFERVPRLVDSGADLAVFDCVRP